jgi:Ferritin-like domain
MAPEPALGEAPEDPRSRRQLLAGGAAALGAAALLGGCGSSTPAADTIPLNEDSPGAKRDIAIMNGLLDLEYHAIYAYTASVPVLASIARADAKQHAASHAQKPAAPKKTKGPAPPLSTVPLFAPNASSVFLSQEIDHSIQWKVLVKLAGGKPARPAPSYDLRGNPASRRDVLLVLHAIEQTQLTAYLGAATTLSPGQLRATAAGIFANHAQQLMVLRMQLGLPPIPSAFVTGQE